MVGNKYRRNPKSLKRVGIIQYLYDMKAINFQIVAAAQDANSVFGYSNFSESGPCDMCWGDLSL